MRMAKRTIPLLAATLIALSALPAAAAPVQPVNEQLARIRDDAMSASPSPDIVERIPPVLAFASTLERDGDAGSAGAAINFAVIYALLGGDLAQAIALADRAAALCEAGEDRRCYGNAMNQSGIALWRLNDPYAAMQRLNRGAKAFVDAGDIERAAIARLNAANIRYGIGDLAGALADYDAIDRDLGKDPRWDPVALLNSKAELLVKLGRLPEAKATSSRALAMLQQRNRSRGTRWESDVGNHTRGTLALVEASLGDAAAAIPLYSAYLRSAERSGSPLELYNAHFAFAQGLMKLRRPREAYPHIVSALSLIDETDPSGRRDAYDLASRIAADVGETSEALRHLRAAEVVRNELAAATLRSAVADANAQTAVAEREAQLARRDAEWAAQRARLLGLTALAVVGVILVAVTFFMRYRAQAIEQRYGAVLEERTRMARELHDTLLQGFTGITMQLRAASRTDPARMASMLNDMADQAGRWASETRHAVWDMRATTAGEDLREGLEQAIATARTQSGAEIVLDCVLDAKPGPAVTGALLRVAQEALSNAARHANAARIEVGVTTRQGSAKLFVQDDGVGFRAAPQLSALGGHWGLLGMRERVEALGGTFRADAEPGRGTRITAEVPI